MKNDHHNNILDKDKALEKFKELVKDVHICMFTTLDDKYEMMSRPMATIDTYDNGDVWFFTNEYSEKVQEVSWDQTVNLIYSHPGKNIYVNVKGRCKVIDDHEKMKELWTPAIKAWFPDGLDDPKLCLLKVTPLETYYWNSSANKLVVLFSMLTSLVTKEGYPEGESGRLNLH